MEDNFVLMGLIGGVLIGIGLVLIYNKNTEWQWQEGQNRRRGLTSERTGNWEAASTVQGYICIAVGIVVLFGSYNLYSQKAASEAARNACGIVRFLARLIGNTTAVMDAIG